MFHRRLYRKVLRLCAFNNIHHPKGQDHIAEMKIATSNARCFFPTKKYLSSDDLNGVCKHWTSLFESQNVPEPDISTELIVAHVLGHKTLYNVDRHTVLTKSQLRDVSLMCQLRLKRMPVQYVIGEWDFLDLTLKMRSPVLIPRPETEELARLCLNTLNQRERLQNEKILEIGSGSGAISLTLLKKFAEIHVVAVDISPAACKLTLENAGMTGVDKRLTVIQGDFYDSTVIQQLSSLGPYDLIVSNPPYITTDEMNNLQPEIHCYEDHVALNGGPDGMNLIKHILSKVPDLLLENGHVWLEVAPQHLSIIANIVKDKGSTGSLCLARTEKDAYGKNRFCHLLKR